MRISSISFVTVVCVAVVLSESLHSADSPAPFEITVDTKLDPTKTYGPIVIKASNITLDGGGAWLVGSATGKPKDFKGTAITAAGMKNVTIKNVKAKGWETGLTLKDCEGVTIEGCDFSDNFHDPDFGWGENGRRGGIVLTRVTKSTLQKNKANRVWDACVLVESDDNTIAENDFSRTSNTCLKLWTSSRNTIERNNLSYGIRISPGEVHARDSTSVLIESGSNDNRLIGNDCTHGGDGIFVRVLNGWCSTGNHFEGNDCSHANNNGVECWAPRNVFVKNKANHCSYGFWMGGSDQSQLIENEACNNGELKGSHNSPHLPNNGHAGIVFMFGPSSHCVARANICRDNNGAGIAIIGDQGSKGQKWKAFHWIVEQNTLERNRWGVYLQYADWLQLGGNRFEKNSVADVHDAGGVQRLVKKKEAVEARSKPPGCVLKGSHSSRVGEEVVFDASASEVGGKSQRHFYWDLGDGTTAETAQIKHQFKTPGFYRLGLTVHDGQLSDLAWRDFYVVSNAPETGTEASAAQWGMEDDKDPTCKITYRDDDSTKIAGKSSIAAVIDPYHGRRVNLLYPRSRDADWQPKKDQRLVFWLKTINPNLPGFQDVNPVVTLHGPKKELLRLTPKSDLLTQPPYNEAREGWKYFSIPLAGDAQWQTEGKLPTKIQHLTIGIDSWGGDPFKLWIDGLAIE